MLAKGRLLGVQYNAILENDLYLELGRHANNMAAKIRAGLKELGISCEEKIEDACTEVYALKLELEWTLEKLDEAQDTRHCPHCGQFNPSAASYCNRCSKKL